MCQREPYVGIQCLMCWHRQAFAEPANREAILRIHAYSDVTASFGGLLNQKRAFMNKHLRATIVAALAMIGFVSPAVAQPINLVPYGSIGPNKVDFEELQRLSFPGLIFDGILVSGNASFAERFAGQTLSIEPPIGFGGGPFDVLSSSANDPLTLQPGDPDRNLSVITRPLVDDLALVLQAADPACLSRTTAQGGLK